jgi:hypothetical protein
MLSFSDENRWKVVRDQRNDPDKLKNRVSWTKGNEY